MKSLTSIQAVQQTFVAICAMGLLCLLPQQAFGQENLTHDSLASLVEDFVSQSIVPDQGESVKIDVSPIDQRIHIPACPAGVDIQFASDVLTQTNLTIKADCVAENWYLFIPVRVMRTQQVVIINDMLSPGSLLTADNLELVDIDKRQIRTSTFDAIEPIVGARIKRRVRPGQPLSPSMLCFVCKGDSVVISANADGLQIKTNGVAEQDGNLGETIRVRNTRSNKLVHARVANSGEVSVNI